VSDAGGRRTSTVTVLFCDLVASTERQSRKGDDAHDEYRRRFFAALSACVFASDGEVVKNTGDGLMVVFRHSAADAVACAIAMHREIDALDDDDPAEIYIGISAGEAAEEEGDWFGTPVNEAARLCAAASPGQTLTNEVVRALVGSRGSFGFRSVGEITLKGLPAPVSAVEVVRTDGTVVEGAAPAADPPVTGPRPPRRSRKPLVIAIAAGVVVVAVIAGTVAVLAGGSGKQASGPTASTTRTNYPVRYAPQACPPDQAAKIPGLTCAVLTVPEDRAKPNGRVVKLDVYRAPARGRAVGDPVLDMGADDLASSPARDQHEEIQVAQRGFGGTPGASPVLTCPEYSKVALAALSKPSKDPAAQARLVGAFRACHDRFVRRGLDLNQYNYLTVGDDVVDLIRALHLHQVNLVSGYVATIGALQAARRLPGDIRTLTLQDPVPGGRSGYSDPTRYLSGAFNAYVALCRADAVCKAASPDLSAALRHDYDAYRKQPRAVRAPDNDGNQRTVLIDGPRVAQAIYAGLFDTSDYAVLAAGIAAPDRSGQVDVLTANRILSFNQAGFDPTYAWGAVMSGACSYDQYTTDNGHTLSSGAVPELSGIDDGFVATACAAWKVDKIASVAFDDPSTDVPTLVVGGALSPGTDQDWPNLFQRTLSHATVVQFPTLPGVLLNRNDPKCLADLRRKFLADPAATLPVPECEAQSPKIHFVGSA
jgi:class 3 adenylate cyclase/pimeloyl-ACP methyl ester carboxylesterase